MAYEKAQATRLELFHKYRNKRLLGCCGLATGACHGIQRDARCHGGVQRFDHIRHRNAGDRIASLSYQTAQAVAFRAEHNHQRIGFETGFADERIAAAVCRAAMKRRPKPLFTVGAGYKTLLVLSRLLPARWVNRIEGRLYG